MATFTTYAIDATTLDDGRTADAIVTTADGAYFGEMIVGDADTQTAHAAILSDEGGDYIDAPADWEERFHAVAVGD